MIVENNNAVDPKQSYLWQSLVSLVAIYCPFVCLILYPFSNEGKPLECANRPLTYTNPKS